MKNSKKIPCKICGTSVQYITKQPDSCDNCRPFLNRTDTIFNDSKRKERASFFEDKFHFAKYIKKLYEEDNKCKYSGISMYKIEEPGCESIYNLFKFSVERENNDGDYHPDNIILVCNVYNLMKNNTDKKTFFQLIITLLEEQYKNGDGHIQKILENFAEQIIKVKNEGHRPLTTEEVDVIVEKVSSEIKDNSN